MTLLLAQVCNFGDTGQLLINNVLYQAWHFRYYLYIGYSGNQGSGLEDVRDDGRPDAYYNLQGQRVGTLRKGRIYINNGRKFVQR